jgi:hypothetical protein
VLDGLALGGVQPVHELVEAGAGDAGRCGPVRDGHRAVVDGWELVVGRLLLLGRLLLEGRLLVPQRLVPLGRLVLVGRLLRARRLPVRRGRGVHPHPVQAAEGVGQREVVEE